MSKITRFGKSIVLAAAFAAIVLAGLNPGIASAQSTANVVVVMPPSVGDFDETIGQSWVDLHLVADHNMYTGTVQTAMKSVDIGAKGHHRAAYRGNREFVANGVVAGDYLLVAHLGNKTLVMNAIHSVGYGDQYGISQTDRITWNGTAMGASSSAPAKPVTVKPVAKAAAVVLTPLCSAILPLAKTGGDAYIMSGGVFSGKVAFVLATSASVLSVEAAQVMYEADGDNAVERDFTGVPVGTPVLISSGAYQVFTVEPNDRLTPLGFLNAPAVVKPATVRTDSQIKAWQMQVAHTAVNRANATCPKYPVDLLAADPARTGGDDDWPSGKAIMVLSLMCLVVGIALLWSARRSTLATNRVAC